MQSTRERGARSRSARCCGLGKPVYVTENGMATLGLVAVDRRTLERRPRRTAFVYRDLIAANALSEP